MADTRGGGPDRAGRLRLARFRQIVGIDVHILQTLLLRGWSVLAGGIMVLFVPYWFGRVEQGYYYTFVSLVAVQIFFELGMNQIVVQIVSHEAAHLEEYPDGRLGGARGPIARLVSLLRLLTRWYRAAAILFFVIGGSAGVVFFKARGQDVGATEIAVWLILVLFTSFNLYISPALSMLEGFGRIGEVARVRLVQSVIGYVTMWIALSLGAGLWATPVLAGVAVIYSLYWLRRHDRRIRWLRTVTVLPGDPALRWRHDVLPLQWRIALSWVSGFLILQLLVPMAFAHQGAIQAGQLGLTMTIFNSLLSIGLSWVNARFPTIAAHLARGERSDARAVFRGILVRSMAVTALGLFAVFMLVALMPTAMRLRFSDGLILACLGLTTIANCAIYAMATFMRAHKEEPLLVQSIVSALLMAPAVYFGSYVSVSVMMMAFCAVIILFSLPWVMTIFRRYYTRES